MEWGTQHYLYNTTMIEARPCMGYFCKRSTGLLVAALDVATLR
jgi:hypothetical protein